MNRATRAFAKLMPKIGMCSREARPHRYRLFSKFFRVEIESVQPTIEGVAFKLDNVEYGVAEIANHGSPLSWPYAPHSVVLMLGY